MQATVRKEGMMNENTSRKDPQYQKKVMEAAMSAGHIMLESGAEITRIEDTINRMCQAFHMESAASFVLGNGIFLTAGDQSESMFAKVRHIHISSTRLDRITAVNQLSREIEEGRYTIEEVELQLDRIKEMPGKSSRSLILASGIGSGCFCYLLGGSVLDSFSAFCAGIVLYFYVIYLCRPHLSKIVGNIGGGAVLTIVCLVMYNLGIGSQLERMVSGAIMPLVPGMAFTNAIREFADENYISGTVRLLDTFLVFFSIAAGVVLIFSLYNRLAGGIAL